MNTKNKTPNFTPVMNNGPSYHFNVFAPSPSNGVASPSSASDESLDNRLNGFLRAITDKQFIKKDLRTFQKIPKPIEPCIVVMQASLQSPHVGLFYCGNVLHLNGHQAAKFEPIHMASLGYERVSFYK
ncbi:MAG: hypothetical protein EOO68_19945 [Moraxellaceae bacterium]|nr:MAG: hypothetical protein EOO68_19945 [Moraxellaceae bacterium]